MDNLSKFPNPDKRHAEIQEIQRAKREALSEEELGPLKDEQDRITNGFLKEELTGAEYNERMKFLDKQEGVIKRNTIVAYSTLLRNMGIPEEGVKEILAHENDHMSEGIQLGVDPVYQIQFLKHTGEDGKTSLGMYPSISFEFPQSMPDDEQRRILRAIIEAPEDLSPRDLDQLG